MTVTEPHLLVTLATVTALELAGQVVVDLKGVLADLGWVAVHDVTQDTLVPHLLIAELQTKNGSSFVDQDLLLAQPVVVPAHQRQLVSPA